MTGPFIIFSADEAFFPLTKGLVLSLLEREVSRHGISLAFIDNGCSSSSLQWLSDHGVTVRSLDPSLLGPLASAATGYLRSIVCRPLLPRLFPSADVIIWIDSDAWVQTSEVLPNLCGWAQRMRDKVFICPEWHYSYTQLNQDFIKNHVENLAFYYRATYGPEVAAEMAARPSYNCGLFAMAADNPLWDAWWVELLQLYGRQYGAETGPVLHMAEQLAMNVLAHRQSCAVAVDPLYNYMCMWGTPFRDNNGKVRVALPPANAIGMVHLSLWKPRRRLYFEQGLLYRSGQYLSDHERGALLA